MLDKNNNGIPDSHEFWYLIVRIFVLLWSSSMLTFSYFQDTRIDKTFMATVMTASAASFGVDVRRKEEEKPKPTRRTTTK